MPELFITHYSKKGHGLAPHPQKPSTKVEVVSGLIGDFLDVELGKRSKGACRGRLLQILKASEDRTEPRCEHAGTCGGCSWQQMNYEAQLRVKEETVRSLFKPFLHKTTFHPIVPCNDPWQYRNKMEFSFSQNKAGEKFLGLIMSSSKGKVVTLNHCHLVSPWFSTLLKMIHNWWENSDLEAFHPIANTGTLRTLTLREGKRTGQKLIMLTVSGNHDYFLNKSHLNAFKKIILDALPNQNPSIYLRIHRAEKGRPTDFYEMHLHGPATLKESMQIHSRTFHFEISPSSFFQPNTLQAEKLYARALELAEPKPSMRVYDLYAGCATLSSVFAPFVQKVIGIELCPYAICDAQMNIEANHLTNLQMIKGDVGKALADFKSTPDLAIVDPPRAGLDPEALKHILRLKPPKLLYISCNPETQAQNVKELVANGYELIHLQPVDQFPHTPHIENIALLVLQ